MTKINLLLLLITNCLTVHGQYTITGSFPKAPSQEIYLKGFTTGGQSMLSSNISDAQGNFSLSYNSYIGAALLGVNNGPVIIVMLNEENFNVDWPNMPQVGSLRFTGSPENDNLAEGIEIYTQTERKRTGLVYLLPLYKDQPSKEEFIRSELQIQDTDMHGFLAGLRVNSYSKYYLGLRRLLSDMPLTANRYIERRSQNEYDFTHLDFTDSRLWNSGLLQELIDEYVILMETYNVNTYDHLNAGVDTIFENLKGHASEKILIAEYMFKLFEKRSLYASAGHLAVSMLSDKSILLAPESAARYEQYRKMAVGNKAPEILFENMRVGVNRLSDVSSKYKLVVFAAGWCPACTDEIEKLKKLYTSLKNEHNTEIVMLSLDDSASDYKAFVMDIPWLYSGDLKGWDGQAVKDYHVFATPTMFLLDRLNNILLKPISAEQVKAWLDTKDK